MYEEEFEAFTVFGRQAGRRQFKSKTLRSRRCPLGQGNLVNKSVVICQVTNNYKTLFFFIIRFMLTQLKSSGATREGGQGGFSLLPQSSHLQTLTQNTIVQTCFRLYLELNGLKGPGNLISLNNFRFLTIYSFKWL